MAFSGVEDLWVAGVGEVEDIAIMVGIWGVEGREYWWARGEMVLVAGRLRARRLVGMEVKQEAR